VGLIIMQISFLKGHSYRAVPGSEGMRYINYGNMYWHRSPPRVNTGFVMRGEGESGRWNSPV